MSSRNKAAEWSHVRVLGDQQITSNPKVECIYFSKQYAGNAVRIRAHLLGGAGISRCGKISESIKAVLTGKEDDKSRINDKKRQLQIIDTQTSQAAGPNKVQKTLPGFFEKAKKDNADQAVARFFYSSGELF